MTLFILLLINYLMDAFLCRKWVVYDFGIINDKDDSSDIDHIVAAIISFTPLINTFFVMVWFGFLVAKSLTFEKK